MLPKELERTQAFLLIDFLCFFASLLFLESLFFLLFTETLPLMLLKTVG